MAAPTYTPGTPAGQVRLLISDVSEPFVFQDAEISAFLAIESDNVKRAAAQAIDSNATNEALASKVLTDSDGKSTDGAKLADAMRKHAAALRAQADRDDDLSDDGVFFAVVSPSHHCRPELTQRPYC
ncbi:MAG: hypothetical protein JWQ74_448 [Marmoricola sp.]|nr:hypothetical protein [Marmoricola sp.]